MDSGSDTSFSSVDHVAATRGLHELRQHYLDTIAKIRDDVLDHVNQTKASAAKKIRYIVLLECDGIMPNPSTCCFATSGISPD